MKKSIISIFLFLCCFSLFSKSANDYFKEGMAFENVHQYIHALSEFYDSMIAYPNKESFNSYYEFLKVKELITNGYPGYTVETSSQDFILGWEHLLLEFEHFWIENNIYDFSVIGTIHETDDELVLNCPFGAKYTEKYHITSETISNGFKKARRKSKELVSQYKKWGETSTIPSEDRLYFSSGFSKYGDSYHTGLMASTYGYIPYSKTEVSFDFYDLEGNYIATTDSKVIINSSSTIWNDYISLGLTSNSFHLDIKCFDEVGKSKILNGFYKIKVKDLYFLGEESKKGNAIEDKVAVDKKKTSGFIEEKLYSNSSILAFFEEEIKRNAIYDDIELVKSRNIEEFISKHFVFVEGGKFEMGNIENPTASAIVYDERGWRSINYIDKYLAAQIPVHSENVNSFYMMNIEVPIYLYNLIIKDIDDSYIEDINKPVESISWYDAIKFCNSMSSFYGLELCYYWQDNTVKCNLEANGFRLPTEKEWEYAARGGSKSLDYTYSGTNDYSDVYSEYGRIKEVISGKPNELNIYNMSGNVAEWCWDWYINYSTEDKESHNDFKVVRGGNYESSVREVTVYAREGVFPNALYNKGIGIRLVRSVK